MKTVVSFVVVRRFMLASCVLAAVAAAIFFPTTAWATTYSPVTHAELQAVLDGSNHTTAGDSAFAATNLGPVSFVGVVINNPSDMLNYDFGPSSAGSQWQVFVEALPAGTYGSGAGAVTVAAGDYGGTALYMAQDYSWTGNTVSATTATTYSYADWISELTRINGLTLKTGDVVLVQANGPGLFYNGKYNINEQHSTSSSKDFSVTVIGSTTPTVSNITLAALKDSSDNFIFDATRATGDEHYQGSLVHLDNLLLSDPSDWINGGIVTVTQGTLTFQMQLGLDPGLASTAINAAKLKTTPFSVTAIVDQEGGNLTAGYSLWLTNASELALDGDANQDGSVDGTDLGIVLADYNKTGDWAMGDFNGDGSVDGADLGILLANYDNSLHVSSSLAVAAVPEPPSLLLAATGLMGLLFWARRKRT